MKSPASFFQSSRLPLMQGSDSPHRDPVARSRRRIGAAFLPLLLASLIGSNAQASDMRRGDEAWERRSQGVGDGGRPSAGATLESIAAYQEALEQRPDDLEARWKLLRSLHFAGDFVETRKPEQLARFDRAREIAEEGIANLARETGSKRPLHTLDPASLRATLERSQVDRDDVARLYFWSAINWGSWARVGGLLAAVRQGVANRLHDYTRVTIALEPDYWDGAAYRLLGRLHAELPRVPFFSGWVDREEALPLIERAHALAPADPGNRLLLALTLLESSSSRRSEAIGMLNEVENLTPRDEMRIEDLKIRELARKRLSEVTSQPKQGRG